MLSAFWSQFQITLDTLPACKEEVTEDNLDEHHA
jgi:hypothetical protein